MGWRFFVAIHSFDSFGDQWMEYCGQEDTPSSVYATGDLRRLLEEIREMVAALHS